jgi:hypothetical protein
MFGSCPVTDEPRGPMLRRLLDRTHTTQALHANARFPVARLRSMIKRGLFYPSAAKCQPQASGTPLVVEYSKCKASPGWTTPKIACAATAASLNPCRISLSFPG